MILIIIFVNCVVLVVYEFFLEKDSSEINDNLVGILDYFVCIVWDYIFYVDEYLCCEMWFWF